MYMSFKRHQFSSRFSPDNILNISGARFHYKISHIEAEHKEKFWQALLTDYCWILVRGIKYVFYKRSGMAQHF